VYEVIPKGCIFVFVFAFAFLRVNLCPSWLKMYGVSARSAVETHKSRKQDLTPFPPFLGAEGTYKSARVAHRGRRGYGAWGAYKYVRDD
jgi:hypothetical protein